MKDYKNSQNNQSNSQNNQNNAQNNNSQNNNSKTQSQNSKQTPSPAVPNRAHTQMNSDNKKNSK